MLKRKSKDIIINIVDARINFQRGMNMFNEEYMSRINWQQITQFFLTGSSQNIHKRNCSDYEYAKKKEQEYQQALRKYRKCVLEHEMAYRAASDEDEKIEIDDELADDVQEALGSLLSLYYEQGLKAGIKLGMSMSDSKLK